jgi:hypothetical protein
MPSADQHRSKAERNRSFLNSISLDDFPEWVAVAAFYTAVHWIELARAKAGDGDSTSHEDRLNYVQNRLPPGIHSAYYVLQNVSMLARYQSMADFFAQFQPEDVAREIVNNRLVQIETYVGNLPGSTTGVSPK